MTGRTWPSAWWPPSSPFIRSRGIGGLGDGAERRTQRAISSCSTLLAYLRLRTPPVFAPPLLGPGWFASSSSLAAKPMAVTLPFLLLLLDYWPLGRKKGESRRAGRAWRRGANDALRWRLLLSFPLTLSPALAARSIRRRRIPLLAIACLFCLLAVHGQDTVALEVNREYALRMADRQRDHFLRRLPGAVFLPREPGALLSAAAAIVAGCGRWPAAIWRSPPSRWRQYGSGGNAPTCWSAGCGTSACCFR